MYYAYELAENRYKPLKILLLAILEIAQIANAIWLIGSMFVSAKYAALCVAVGVILVVAQLGAACLTHTYEYTLREHTLEIRKRYPVRACAAIVIPIRAIEQIRPRDGRDSAVCACPNACRFARYVIQLSDGREYCVALDEYARAYLSSDRENATP